ncbi:MULTISPECIES: methyl-accepting chemotaxis protein [unclassified Vibrio]|uniref:Methyl-accepting chemotaxis protein n=1 Tax=Vibrio sp. HB236076 TaxID=3232307 RepID=A0AB39HE22_9VIBR|nr:methyl-accepting chemotaxis protein [Vibrio sp. HB161653]MDP5254514.1 methyl-accepting chemotaxis protein [Vibrio sp. HB161653]
MEKVVFKPWERVVSDVRLVPKMIILMLGSTIMIVLKQLWDAETFYQALLSATQSVEVAKAHYHQYLVRVAWQTAALILAFWVILMGTARVMLKQIRYLTAAIDRLAEKNLSQPISLVCKDEYGDLAKALETSRLQLQDMIRLQADASKELMDLSEVMTICMVEAKSSAQEEFSEIDQLATAMSEMSSTVQTVASNAGNASSITESAASQAAQGQQFLRDTVAKMNALSGDIASSAQVVEEVQQRVEQIGSMVGTIQSISEQTNLLALNAAIEAARAGEAGRGFAVVADEVRNLAKRTQDATVEIQAMIGQLQSSTVNAVTLMEKSVVETAEGVALVTQAGSELDSIVIQVQDINDMNFQIASAASQQSTVAEEMNANLTNVRGLVEASVTVMSELHESSETMHNNTEQLDSKIQSFQV